MKSMRFKLWLTMMALVLMMLVLLWFFQIVFLGDAYRTMHLKDARQDVYDLLSSLQEDSGWMELADKLAYSYNAELELVDRDGNLLYEAGQTQGMPMMMHATRNAVLLKALSGEEGVEEVVHPRFGNKILFFSFPLILDREPEGAMLLQMPMAPVEETASILKRQLLTITLILLTLALILSLFLSKGFTKPLGEIRKVSESMASGDFSARVKTSRQDEIGQLAHTVNHLGEQLGKTEALRKELIGNVSHELRTPLSLIRGYAETLRDVTGASPEKREKQLGVIIEESDRLRKIVEDMLNLSRLQSGFYTLDLQPVDLKDLLSDVKEHFSYLSSKTGVTFAVAIEGPIQVYADSTRMSQVLYNLINNSFNHTPKGGSISVIAQEKTDRVRISVIDSGSGIAPEDLPHIFDRYYQSEKKPEQPRLGTGLGLAIVKGILEAHQAPYGVESTVGTGTTIWFDLKKASEP